MDGPHDERVEALLERAALARAALHAFIAKCRESGPRPDLDEFAAKEEARIAETVERGMRAKSADRVDRRD